MFNAIKLILFLLFICTQSIFAYDSIEVLNPNIKIEKTGYFKTDKELSPEQAYKIAINGNLSQLPQKATSFGFDRDTYWFLFEVSTNSDEQVFFDSKNIVGDYQDLFVFKDGKLIKTQKSGHLVPINERTVKVFPIRFELQKNSKSFIYILRIKSENPRLTSFSFGNENVLDVDWLILHGAFIFTFGVFIALTFYNAFLYFITKDKAYFYYCIYMTGLFLSDLVQLGYLPLISLYIAKNFSIFMLPLTLFTHVGLAFFAIHFLKLREQHGRLRQILIAIVSLSVILSIASVFGVAQTLFVLSIQAIYLFSIYVGIRSYMGGFRPALYYLMATGVGLGILVIFMSMNQGSGVEFGLLGANLLNISMAWDLIFLSLALAYRIKILQQDRDLAERMLQARSRFATLGETIGNIAHQWRQPLTELSLINTNIDAHLHFNGEISKETLLASTKESDIIIKRLSAIIETFYSFFDKREINDTFELSAAIKDVVDFLGGQFDANDIVCNIKNQSSCVIAGNKEEFFQAFLIILNNAKDALVQNKTAKPIVDIIIGSNEISANITIEDNGGGIKIYDIQKIFEPYVSSKGLNGMGIGLFIVKNIIENKLSGAISAKNSKDGAIFTINLPTVKQTKELNFEPNR